MKRASQRRKLTRTEAAREPDSPPPSANAQALQRLNSIRLHNVSGGDSFDSASTLLAIRLHGHISDLNLDSQRFKQTFNSIKTRLGAPFKRPRQARPEGSFPEIGVWPSHWNNIKFASRSSMYLSANDLHI